MMGSDGSFCGASITSFFNRETRLERDTNKTVRARERFFPHFNLVDCCSHARGHQEPVDTASSKFGSTRGFVSARGSQDKPRQRKSNPNLVQVPARPESHLQQQCPMWLLTRVGTLLRTI